MATNFVDVAVQKVKQKASELGKWMNTPSISKDSFAGKITTAGQNYLASPVGRVQQSFLKGGAQGASFGLAQPTNITPTTVPERIAQGVGFGLGAFNPYSLGMKGMNALAGVGNVATKGLISKFAPQATGIIAKNILPVVGQELAQTAGYGLATTALGNKFNPATDLAFGLGIRGLAPGLGAVGKVLKMDKGAILENVMAKQTGQILQEYDQFGRFSMKGLETARDVLVKLKLKPKEISAMMRDQEGLYSYLKNALNENQSFAYHQLPGMKFADTQATKGGGKLKPNQVQGLLDKAFVKDLDTKEPFYLQSLMRDLRDMKAKALREGIDTTGTNMYRQGTLINNLDDAIGRVSEARAKLSQGGVPNEYKTAVTQIKKYLPEIKTKMVSDLTSTPGKTKSLNITTPSGGELIVEVKGNDMMIWSAGNPVPKGVDPYSPIGMREKGTGTGEVTKAIRSLMALAKDENKNIHVIAPNGSGYWEHLGFKNSGMVSSTGLTPEDLAKIPKLSEFSPQPEGGVGVSTPKEIRTNLEKDVAQISKPVLEKQLKGEITTPTKATQAVSSEPIIRQKGQLNLQRLKVEGEGKKVLTDINKEVKPTVIGNKEVIEAARTAKGNKGAMSDAQMKNLLAQQLKNRQKVVDLNVRFNQAKAEGATEVELGKIMLDMVNQSKTARQGGTFAGRLLQAQNIIADRSASPVQKILALLDNAGVAPEKYLQDSVKVNWDNPTEVVAFYRKYVPPKFGELLDEYRYSNMLSSPLTHIINTASNALQTGIVAPIEKTISGALDWGKSTLTGSERQYYTRAGIDYAGGYVKALPQAFKKAWKVLSGEDVLVKPDYERVPLGTTGAAKAFSTPLRALEAMDQFFKTLVEGGVTAELKKGPQKLPLSQISDQATKEANYRLFRQAFDPNGELGQGAVLKMFDKWNSAIANLRRLPGGKWVLPFLQTPTNILKQGLEYSPLGATTAIGAKAPIEQLSKAIIGTGVFMGAYQLAQNGLTTWESPTSETERELYYAAGMQPYSVKIGNNWVSFSKLGPLSYPIAMAAAIASAEKNNPDKSMTENLTSGISGILGFFGDQSYVRSIGDLVDAIQGGVNIGPTALSAEGANLAGQLIPYRSFLTWLGRITDPTYRKATGFVDRLKKDMPVVGSELQPYTDIYGQPSKRDYPILNAVSPFRVTQEKPKEAEMVGRYQLGKIRRAVEKRADEAFVAGDTKSQVTGQIFRYIDESGALKKIDTGKVTNLPNESEYEKAVREKEAYKLADDIVNLPVDEQAAAFAAIGISPEDAVYYNTAKQDNRLKGLYIDEEISKLDTKNRANLINYLISQRKEVNGDMVLSNTKITELNDAGTISDAEATMLKNLKIVNGKPVTKLTGRGKKTALKKVSLPTSTSKIKAPKIKSMSTLLKGSKLKVKKYKFRRTL